MNAAEILRGLADVIDKVSRPQQTAQSSEVTADFTDHTDKKTMIPPLQQKHELLKKAAGVESIYDDEESAESDPLDQMKKHAGIQVVAHADEDAGE